MKRTMNRPITNPSTTWAIGLCFLAMIALSGCAIQRPSVGTAVYDFGPGATQTLPSNRMAPLPPLEMGVPHASPALSGTAVLYRLSYADVQQLKPYALARWSMPPAQLLGQRVRAHLSLRRAVTTPGDIVIPTPARQRGPAAHTPAPVAAPEPLLNLRLELEEFSQVFASPQTSAALVRVRATVSQRSASGESLLAQRSFITQHPAPTPDAQGGVRALAAAAEQISTDIGEWLAQMPRTLP